MVVQLDVPDEVLVERIEARWLHLPSGRVYNTTYNPPKVEGLDDITGEPLTKRMDDNHDVFQKRLAQYHEQNKPIMQYYKDQGALVTLSGRTRSVHSIHSFSGRGEVLMFKLCIVPRSGQSLKRRSITVSRMCMRNERV